MSNLNTQEIQEKVEKIKIFTKRLMRSYLIGDYLSAFKGSGLEFEQIREYQLGDDVRFIDWNASAKANKIMIKQFVEERERVVILLIDVSRSSNFSSKKELRKDMIAKVAATLAFIASNNKDRVGVLFFSDKIEKWIAPSRSKMHIANIIESIFSIEPKYSKTNINKALNFLIGLKKNNAIVFVLSDWIDDIDNFSNILKIASCKYDFIGIRFVDNCETNLPDVGFLHVQDLESGEFFEIDTRRKNNIVNTNLQARLIKQKKVFAKYRIDLLDLTVGQAFVNPLINFFKQRIRRQI
ncbi:DUF58 domain-containing protein [Candidatus Babeliales bacterium]|nr:DUF58 domain-containing protein [Candidatus Babeliales bacterium]MCF7899070.1 DUF58 domain-containing protein [Candidatus Babeliales bacterium]